VQPATEWPANSLPEPGTISSQKTERKLPWESFE
jgi:hypothetical protein